MATITVPKITKKYKPKIMMYEIKYINDAWSVYVGDGKWKEFPSGFEAFVFADAHLHPKTNVNHNCTN